MAKLIKAATALRNANKIDFQQIALDNIAGQIAYQAERGETKTDTYVRVEFVDGITSALLKAGYQVSSEPESYYDYSSLPATITGKKGCVRRLLDKLFGAPVVAEELNSFLRVTNPDIHLLSISWGPVPETTLPEEAELSEPVTA